MEKYKSFSSIRKVDIEKFAGLANELITRMENPNATPVSISCYGITFPTPDYYIKRFPTRGYILEHILSGKGYVIVNDKKYTVRTGDTYLLKPGQNCEYFSDKEDPYKKLWVNFSGTIFYDVYGTKEKQSAQQLPSPGNVLETRGIGLHRREAVANVVTRTDSQYPVRDEDAVF